MDQNEKIAVPSSDRNVVTGSTQHVVPGGAGDGGGLRIVVDTNVLMGGLINPVKASGRVIGFWLEGKVIVLLSPQIREEYLYIFNKMRFGAKEAVSRREQALEMLLNQKSLILVEPGPRLNVVKEDPSDNRFIECAVAGRADYVVSQDRHLWGVKEYGGVKIVTAHAFLSCEFPAVEKDLPR